MEKILKWLGKYTRKKVYSDTYFSDLNWDLFDEAVALDWAEKNLGIDARKFDQEEWFNQIKDFISWVNSQSNPKG